MMIAVWLFVALLLGLWSLAAWGLSRLLGFDPARLGELKPMVDQIPGGAWLGAWLPGWQDMLRWLIDLTQMLLGAIGGAAPVIVWVGWAIGALVIVGLGGLLSLIVVLVRKSAAPTASAR